MNIAIIGASGCIGTNLTRHLIDTTGHTLTLFSHNANDLTYSGVNEERMRYIDGDILNPKDIEVALLGCDVAIYLVHLMGADRAAFDDAEARAAKNFVQAVKASTVKSIVYVGGMGHTGQKLTRHLGRREQTGVILTEGLPNVTIWHTPMVIGKNAAGFEVIRSLVRHFPVLPVPAWANGTTRPIIVDDVSKYIVASVKNQGHNAIDIGGPESLTYLDVIRRYAAFKHRTIVLIPLPFIPKRFVAWLFRLFKKSKSAITVADMIESATYSTDSTKSDTTAVQFPGIVPVPIEEGFY